MERMAKWKITRESFGDEEFTFNENEQVTIGRGLNNKIVLTSSVVSRNHCIINVFKDHVVITDLKSSNGTYISCKKLIPNKPCIIKDSDTIGIGWTFGVALGKKGITEKVDDVEKYVFKLTKEGSLSDRIKFQSENEVNGYEIIPLPELQSESKILMKRKIELDTRKNLDKEQSICNKSRNKILFDEDIISILSDSDNDMNPIEPIPKKVKLEVNDEDQSIQNKVSDMNIKQESVKIETSDMEYEAFNVKQEYFEYDEPIEIDSNSDGESEQWVIRLSQSSPGKPFTKQRANKVITREMGSYSQLDDIDGLFSDNDEEEVDDMISLIPPPKEPEISENCNNDKPQENDDEDELDDLIQINFESIHQNSVEPSVDKVDGFLNKTDELKKTMPPSPVIENQQDISKITQMIEPLVLQPKRKSHYASKSKAKTSSKTSSKVPKSPPKQHISISQKEERKKRLKEIAEKEKDNSKANNSQCTTKTINVKNSSSNRGAFLTDVAHAVVKPIKRKDSPSKSLKSKEKSLENISVDKQAEIDVDSKKKSSKKSNSKKDKHRANKPNRSLESSSASRKPLKSLKPLTESEESHSGKPFSKVEPLSQKSNKKVRFSDAPPQIREFEIEDGNRMKKTSSINKLLVDIQQKPVFSLEKITLMKILRWNPHWLDEQINNNNPPPILGHKNTPMAICHSFSTHHQYVELIGDLLLMEIWGCVSQAYMRIRNQNYGLKMRIESIPPAPSPDRCLDLFCISVNVSLPKTDLKNLPRMGEIMHVMFGPENARCSRFFFVHNVRTLPSPPNNIYSFFSISLQGTFTDKMKTLSLGGEIVGRSLAYISKDLMLFEAMGYLAGSPLQEAILRPEPRHFVRLDPKKPCNIQSRWTSTLNESQLRAVRGSVEAALGDKPCIQMVQGPPGTGKSSVICAIVMTYLYDPASRRQASRGKILVCATSNAAVDELVVRLLNIRQSLPKAERFRMVRVGRCEAMHPRARDVSSQQLAQRDQARCNEPSHPAARDEISHLEAKINMWKTQAQDAKDPVRIAYCEGRIQQLVNRIALMSRGGGGGSGEVRGEQLASAEKRIIEGADIIVTTLASAANYKMHGLKRRIALCIVDEAGQAIEPETLIPLTLHVTKLTLIGDPQQLPGFICSQRAKQHGLGESLFSRLTSNSEHWSESPVVLLNQQYRMHPEIADYPNRAFYGGRIRSMTSLDTSLKLPPYRIICISSGDKGQGACIANEMEARGAARLAAALAATAPTASLALITPYNAHKELIKRNLRLLLPDSAESGVEVNTVDSFQGQERDVVVVSLARSQGVGFLNDVGRMNVLLTRAKRSLLVCLNPHAIMKNPQWRTLLEDAQRRKLYKVLPNKLCQPVTSPADQNSHEDILRYIC